MRWHLAPGIRPEPCAQAEAAAMAVRRISAKDVQPSLESAVPTGLCKAIFEDVKPD